MEAIVRDADLYRSSFEAFEEARPPGEPGWLTRLRREALARFQELGFPVPTAEAWRFTNISPIARTPFDLARDGPALVSADSERVAEPAARLVFVNGHFRKELSRVPAIPGLRVESLQSALADRPADLEPHLARHADFRTQAFTAWNTAFLDDGAVVEIDPGVVIAAPIEIQFLSSPGDSPAVSHPRILIFAGPASQATVVERYEASSRGAGIALTNSVTEIILADGANVEHYKVQREALNAYHVHTVQIRQERSSHFTSHNLAFGSALARTDINAVFTGEGGECSLNGLFVGAGTQHLDTHTLIDHARPHCSSRELYKGVLDGKSRGVFHGTIVVRPGAQKTDAMQTNRNLLLSNEALVDSTPALEIFADDVKCKHGSTIGQIDAAALFYLRSRGIDEGQARSMLTYAFAADVADRLRLPEIRSEVQRLLGQRLASNASSQAAAS